MMFWMTDFYYKRRVRSLERLCLHNKTTKRQNFAGFCKATHFWLLWSQEKQTVFMKYFDNCWSTGICRKKEEVFISSSHFMNFRGRKSYLIIVTDIKVEYPMPPGLYFPRYFQYFNGEGSKLDRGVISFLYKKLDSLHASGCIHSDPDLLRLTNKATKNVMKVHIYIPLLFRNSNSNFHTGTGKPVSNNSWNVALSY